jgi:hypothetical protein
MLYLIEKEPDMKGKTMSMTSSIIVPLFLGLLIAGIVFASQVGRSLPLIATPRASLIALLVVGMAMCMGGIGQVGASGRWASPLAIVGYLLGAAILIIIVAGLAGWKLPLITDEKQAVASVGILIAVKFVIGTVGYFFRLL